MKVTVVELSGCTHEVSDLKPTDSVKDLYGKLELSMPPGSGRCCLVVEDRILTSTDHGKSLCSIGIVDGMTLPMVRISQSEVFEFTGDVGDEERAAAAATAETVVRLSFTSDSTCLLIRQTHYRSFTGAFVWDICRGTYTVDAEDVAACSWDLCFRRRRAGVERNGSFGITDSGWIRRQKIPQSLKEIPLNKGDWKRKGAMFQEGDAILGIRLSGRNNCAEAITLMAL